MPGGKVSFTNSTPQVGTVVLLPFTKEFFVDDSVAFAAFENLFTDRTEFLDGASFFFMVAVARQRFEVPVAIAAVRPRIDAVGSQAVSVPTHFTRVFTTVILLMIVRFFARVAPIIPVQVGAHGRDDVEMMIVVQ